MLTCVSRTQEEETELAKDIRESVLKGVEALHAYLPLPSTDMLYFKRMLLRMQAGDELSQKWCVIIYIRSMLI